MSSRQSKYQKHGYLIEEICQTYPNLNREIEMKMLEFRAQFPSEYRDWYDFELLPLLRKLQQRQHWSHSSTPDSYRISQNSGYHSRHDQSYSRMDQRLTQKRQEEFSSRSQSRIFRSENDSVSCFKKFDLPHTFSTIVSNRCVLLGQGKHFSSRLYPTTISETQYVTNLEQLKELIPLEDKKCFYEYLQTHIDQSSHLSEKLLYELVLLHLKLKSQTEPNDISELLLDEYKKMQGDQFLKYKHEETLHDPNDIMSRDTFMSQPQDSFSTDGLAISREQFISQDLTRDEFISQEQFHNQNNGSDMSRDQFIAQDKNKTLQSQDEDKIVFRLRKLLLNGSKHKALRWAIDNQEWVSALFIASSMDDNTYEFVCSRYIESIPRNDPLRSCLQVQFGLEIDYQYSDDWGIHLAAILNNAQDATLISKFANILGEVKDICGQHFCYLSARIQPGSSTDRDSLFVLVGAENQLLSKLIPIQSVMLTMAYDDSLPHLQYYKYYVALNYVKMGVYELSLCLLQNIANVFLSAGTSLVDRHYALVSYVYDLSLQIYNRVHVHHVTWINSLGSLINSTQANSHANWISSKSPKQSAEYGEFESKSQVCDEANLTQSINEVPMCQYLESTSQHDPNVVQDIGLAQMTAAEDIPSMPSFQVEQAQPISSFYVPSYDSGVGPASMSDAAHEDLPPADTESVGTISIHSKFTYAEDKIDSPPQNVTANPPAEKKMKENSETQNIKPQTGQRKKSGKEAAGSWLSFLKFARPKNQMILPDDNKPSIVWDEEKKMWVDVNSDGKSEPSALPPPPKMSQHTPLKSQSSEVSGSAPMSLMPLDQNGPAPMKMNSQNVYRKGKSKYVNVLAGNN